ncbi:MAG: hypothetical protein P1P88_04920 [Bacteroidales bacterium]|nr:hypothetical protein [Bacteroidales bacterium]
MEKITYQKKRKLTDTELNVWVKNLPVPQKEIFYEKIDNCDALWIGIDDMKDRRKRFNNYRYKGVSKPDSFSQLLIYVSALYAQPDLKIETIFPNIDKQFAETFVPIVLKKSTETNNFNYNAENKT